jgi:N-acetylated-alpha-linked acidic dipeptidase
MGKRTVVLMSAGLIGVALASGAAEPAAAPALRGFSAEASARQRELERRFREEIRAENVGAAMKHLSARPHHVGSPYGRELAEWILARFREWGLEARIETFDVLFPTPKQRVVEMVSPVRFVAKLAEPAVAGDPTSAQRAEQLPTYNAYSIDGDVTAPLVYVNYGIPEDYEELERLGVSVEGAIAIARYGRSWRGIKPKVAAQHGAVGCLIYSDPADDGYVQGEVFPEGPFRPRTGVQRGSVADGPYHSGDPLTPGVGATEGAKRLPLGEAKTLTRIPVLPLSYGDAQPLLDALEGPVAPPAWRGGLPITYRVGPGPARVRLAVASAWDLKPAHDVIATIPGAVEPDQWVIRGNHHDAWVNGAEDPISGLAPLLEEARALGVLLETGWRPRRTLVYAAWDAEEPGLLGSTEWAETHAEELRRKALAYLNTDGNGRGFLSAAGSPMLEPLVSAVARELTDPESGVSVFRREQLRRLSEAKSKEEREELRSRGDLRIGPLGSGSDYTPFYQHLGIAALHLGYGGEDEGGIYHSIYDDMTWFARFSDSDFAYGRLLAQTAGTLALRLAQAEVVPYDFRSQADTLKKRVGEVKKLLEEEQEKARERNRQLDEGVFQAVRDPRRPLLPPRRKDVPPHLNFAPLDNAVERLSRAAEGYEAALAKADLARAAAANALLVQAERRTGSPEGLPGRPWYRNLLDAPGFYTGYSAKTLPSVREAIELGKWAEAESEAARVAKALESQAALVEEAAKALAAPSS